MIRHWKKTLFEGAAGIFERGGKAVVAAEIAEDTVRELHAKIGGGAGRSQRFFITKAQALDRKVRRGMIETDLSRAVGRRTVPLC